MLSSVTKEEINFFAKRYFSQMIYDGNLNNV